jgi:peptidoglycan/LPS O-acetylase OafA/YrhL
MGRLRLCCCAIILMSCAGIVKLHTNGASILAPIALVIGVLLLAAVAPFPAYDRQARMRVLYACGAYAALSALAAIIFGLSHSGGVNALLLALPAMGTLLAIWAYLSRNRRRVSGVSTYHKD